MEACKDYVDVPFTQARLEALSSVLKPSIVASLEQKRHMASFVVNLCAGRVPNAAWVVEKVATPVEAAAIDTSAPSTSETVAHHVNLDGSYHDPASANDQAAASEMQQTDVVGEACVPGPQHADAEQQTAPAPVARAPVHVPPAPAAPSLSAAPLPSQPSHSAGAAGMPFSLPAAGLQAAAGAGGFNDSSTMAADMLHGILVEAAKAKGEDTSTYVQKAIQNPAIMQVCTALCGDNASVNVLHPTGVPRH